MPSTKTASVASRLATFLLVLGSALVCGCDSGPLNSDGGSGGGHQAGAGGAGTGAAGSAAGGAAGSKTGHAGASGGAGSPGSGSAGAHGGNDGGAAGKDGGLCACAAIYAPVCGSDGKTYPSRCDADCAGVVVAHDGACTAPPKDAGADGPLGHCDQDSECENRPATTNGCSCAQVCAAKTDPEPPPPKFRCGIVCPNIVISCTCVNHLCTSAAPITPG